MGDYLTWTSVSHGILYISKMNDVKGETDGVCLREESVGSNEVGVVGIPASLEDGMEGEGEGIERGVMN